MQRRLENPLYAITRTPFNSFELAYLVFSDSFVFDMILFYAYEKETQQTMQLGLLYIIC